MKNKLLIMVFSCLLNLPATSHAQRFYLWNITDTSVNASIRFLVSCPAPWPFKGYLTVMSNDTLYIKAFYRPVACYAQFQSTNRDTMYNVAFPAGTNYINISKNHLNYNESTQTYDTSWNRKDSTFSLHPVGINDLSKNVLHIAVYPNPAQHTLYFESGLEYQAVHVYNSIGQLIATYPYNNTKSIDIGSLAKGSYFLKLTGKKEEILGRARFVK